MEEKELNELRQLIGEVKQELKDVLTILKGEPDSATPSGLIYRVNENTHFRQTVMKIFWLIFSANIGGLGVLVYLIWTVTRSMGGQ